jgi:hypothetical protein
MNKIAALRARGPVKVCDAKIGHAAARASTNAQPACLAVAAQAIVNNGPCRRHRCTDCASAKKRPKRRPALEDRSTTGWLRFELALGSVPALLKRAGDGGEGRAV